MTALFGCRAGESRRLLAYALWRVWGLEELPPLTRGPMGKPAFAHLPGRHFNLSHSGALTLVALGDKPVGVDIEVVRPRRAGLPAYALTPGELAAFREGGSLWEDFYTLWTQKEAWCKRDGGGVTVTTPVEVPAEAPLATYSGPGWRGALCVEGPLPSAITWVTEEELARF